MLQPGYVFVEHVETPLSNGLPFLDRGCPQDPVDLVQRQTGVLQHADEYESAKRLGAVTALSGLPDVRGQETSALVVANRGGGDLGPPGHLADGEKRRHIAT